MPKLGGGGEVGVRKLYGMTLGLGGDGVGVKEHDLKDFPYVHKPSYMQRTRMS